MESGPANTQRGEPEWWIDSSLWPGPYAEPTVIESPLPHAVGGRDRFYREIDKSHIDTLEIRGYQWRYAAGAPLVINGELLGWIITVNWTKNGGGFGPAATTLDYQPYITPLGD